MRRLVVTLQVWQASLCSGSIFPSILILHFIRMIAMKAHDFTNVGIRLQMHATRWSNEEHADKLDLSEARNMQDAT